MITAARDGPDDPSVRYIDAYLAPLLPTLSRQDVTDIFVNCPGELWVETLSGTIERHNAPELDEKRLWHLARQVASLSHQGISREHPLLAATLADGARIQIVAPPATRGDIAIAIRKHVVQDLGLDAYVEGGALADTRFSSGQDTAELVDVPTDMGPAGLSAYLTQAVRSRKNILVSGGTSTGKTTFLNALIKEIPAHERIILIEDTAEVRMIHANAVGLLANKGELGEARVTADDLLQASLRMRPDRIILGEVRGTEAYTFLRAINTGHPGSLTTLHANSPEGAIDQLALIILQSGTQLRHEDIVRYVMSVVDIIVQLERRDGHRAVTRIMTTRPQDAAL